MSGVGVRRSGGSERPPPASADPLITGARPFGVLAVGAVVPPCHSTGLESAMAFVVPVATFATLELLAAESRRPVPVDHQGPCAGPHRSPPCRRPPVGETGWATADGGGNLPGNLPRNLPTPPTARVRQKFVTRCHPDVTQSTYRAYGVRRPASAVGGMSGALRRRAQGPSPPRSLRPAESPGRRPLRHPRGSLGSVRRPVRPATVPLRLNG